MRIRNSSSIASSSSYSSISTSLSPCTTLDFSSSSANSSSSSMDSLNRCDGLDLLVKAVLHVAGSLLVVPFTQRRVIRRRKRAFKFCKFEFVKKEQESEPAVTTPEGDEEEEKVDKDEDIELIHKDNKRKREMALPLKYHDSVLQPWKRSTRRRRSVKIDHRSMENEANKSLKKMSLVEKSREAVSDEKEAKPQSSDSVTYSSESEDEELTKSDMDEYREYCRKLVSSGMFKIEFNQSILSCIREKRKIQIILWRNTTSTIGFLKFQWRFISKSSYFGF